MPYLKTLYAVVALLASTAMATDAEGKAFLAENAKKEGVTVLASGLQYKVLKAGPDGAPSPEVDTPCDCHYQGTLIDGTKFDSSYDRGEPTKFAPNQVIKGWTEAMQIMKEGDKWELFIPSELAYGESGSGSTIKGGNALVFEMEIIKVRAGETSNMLSQITDTLTKRIFTLPDPLNFIVRLWHLLALYGFFSMGGFNFLTGGGSAKKCVASHILVKDLAKCEEIKEEIARAEDSTAAFAEAAKKHSTCPSGKKGGSLGEFGPGQMVPAFDKVCFGDCPLGEVQGPVQTQFGYHLLIVEKRTEPAAKPKEN